MMGPKEAKKRFMKAVRMVQMNNAMSKCAAEIEEEDSLLNFSAFAEKCKTDEGDFVEDLTFDKKYYKAKKEFRLSQEVKNILNVEVKDRTEEQLKKSLYGLQSLQSFCEYPLHIQDKLNRVAFFHSVPPKRVIIRQGHNAEMFYFIISGQVIVTIMETDPISRDPISRIVNVLRRGACFGELALIHHSKRTATVTSDSFCELLSIGREDFHDIFMRVTEPGKDPPHIEYLRTLPLVRHWPVHLLLEDTEMCLFHYYKRSTVICKDSNDSEWLYIIKSGTCQVIKQLEDVQPLSHRHLRRRYRSNQAKPEDGDNYARNGTNIRSKIDTGRRSKSTSSMDCLKLPDIFDPNSIMMSESFRSLSSRDTRHMALSSSRGYRRPDDTRTLAEYLRKEKTTLSSISRLSVSDISDAMSISTSRTYHRSSRRQNHLHSGKQVFVQLEILHSRDIFGLTNLCSEEGLIDSAQPSVSLVSRGAECILLNKKFFYKNFPDIHRHILKSYVQPYPLHHILQDRLQDHANWQTYKQQMMHRIVTDQFKIMT